MINTDRVVPVQATDLITLYGVILKQDSNNSGLVKLAASAPGEFTVATDEAVVLAAEPVTSLNFTAAVSTGATVFFVPALDFKGFTVNGSAVTPTGSISENGKGSDLYKAVNVAGAITISKIGF